MKQKQNDKSDNYLMTLNLKVSIFLCLFLIYSFTASSTNGSTPPLATNDSVSVSCSPNSVTYSFFDPIRNQLKFRNITNVNVRGCQKLNGMAVWYEAGGSFTSRVNFSIYDVIRGDWRDGLFSNNFSDPLAAGVTDGTLFWFDSYRPTPTSLVFTLNLATYDAARGFWATLVVDNVFSNQTDINWSYDMVAIKSGASIGSTVNLIAYNHRLGGWIYNTFAADRFTGIGFNTGNNTFNWFNGGQSTFAGLNGSIGVFLPAFNTVPISHFAYYSLNKAAVPAQVVFWDLSTGASSINWNFGDNSFSSQRSPLHNFGRGFFRVQQTAITPISTNSSYIVDVFGYANPIDEPRFFVRQQYLDFLERDPLISDVAGLDFWTGQITACGNDTACISQKRILVSKAFFLSEEFRLTGSYTYNLHMLTYGSNSSFLPNFNTFTTDRRLVVAQGQTDLAHGIVRRSDFTNRYPSSLGNTQLVDSIFNFIQNVTGFTYPIEQRGQFYSISGNGQLDTRLLIVRAIANDAQVTAAARNRTFVTTEYIGYLRRTPDLNGFNFWLNILNQSPTNENGMVCAFITSAEYQRRFSSNVTRNNAECGGMPSGPDGPPKDDDSGNSDDK